MATLKCFIEDERTGLPTATDDEDMHIDDAVMMLENASRDSKCCMVVYLRRAAPCFGVGLSSLF